METTEYEVRVLEINVEELIKKLENLNATKVGEYNYRRYIYNFNPRVYEKWIRLRTNGTKTTLTIKKIENYGIGGTKELEIEVSDFEKTNQILQELGYHSHSFQENKRVRYLLDEVELDIDTWPLIPVYLEIEGKSEQAVEKMIEKLDISKEKVTTLDVQGVFREIYGIDISDMKELKFQ